MNPKIKDLMERIVIKMLEEDLNNNESIISSQDGKTIVATKQNSMVPLLLYLQLTSEDGSTWLKKDESATEGKETKEVNEEESVVTASVSEEENEIVLEKINDLQQKNKQFQQELAEMLHEPIGE